MQLEPEVLVQHKGGTAGRHCGISSWRSKRLLPHTAMGCSDPKPEKAAALRLCGCCLWTAAVLYVTQRASRGDECCGP
ncbi:hypothetical protein H920_20191 [Fukomys damarensis]|uniref:Uncharacterized protein n=1 Tax=Fukomys damarensis TaxID=885580 RepID=A0A091CLZ5_FUKDA|nr:hypothetical protein H920_20191 [Fukomys damarensis]